MSLSRLVAKNTLLQIVTKLATSVIGLVTRKLLTNYLGPVGFGDYIFILSYVALFGSIADWGTQLVSVREASRSPQLQPKIFGSAILGRLILSVVAAVVALFALPFLHLSPALSSLASFSCLLIIVFTLKSSLGIIFETLMRLDRWFFVEIVASTSTLALFSLGVYFQLPLSWFILFLLIANFVSSAVALLLALRLSPVAFRPDLAVVKRLAIASLPMGGVLILFSVYNRIDTLILKVFSSSFAVGIYGLAYFIFENVIFVAAYLMNATLPVLSRQTEPTAFRRHYQKILDLMLCLSIPATLATFFLSPFLVYVISSPQFALSIPLLRILSFAVFFAFLNHVTGYSLVALGKQRAYFITSLFVLFFNITLNLIFIPHYGALAAAWITVGTEAFAQVINTILLARALHYLPSYFSFPKTALDFIRTRGKIF